MSTRPKILNFSLLLLGALASFFDASAQEHDLLIVRAANGDEKYSRLVGEITDFTSEHAVFVNKGGIREQKIAVARIAEMTLRQSDEEKLGRQHLIRGDLAKASDLLGKAIEKEETRWRKQEIEALLAQCELAEGKIDAAGRRMAAIVESDPDSRLLGYLPLAWVDGFKGPSQSALSEWASSTSPALQLLAASWMLGGEKRKEAVAQLEKLTTSGSRRIAALAEAQLWRTRFATAKPLDAQRWTERVDSFPDDLRTGPSFVAAQATAKADQHFRAAEGFMKVVLLSPLHAAIVPESRFQAALSLERAGARSDSIALLERFINSPESTPRRSEALELLARLQGEAK